MNATEILDRLMKSEETQSVRTERALAELLKFMSEREKAHLAKKQGE
jgi:hypothetical protein